MRWQIKHTLVAVLLVAVSGCTPALVRNAEQQTDNARKSFATGDFEVALNLVMPNASGSDERVRKPAISLLSEPAVKQVLPEAMRAELAHAKQFYEFNGYRNRLGVLERNNLLSEEDAKSLHDELANTVRAAATANLDLFSVAQLGVFGVRLDTLDNELFDHDLKECIAYAMHCDDLMLIVKEKGPSSPFGQRLRSQVKDLQLSALQFRTGPIHDLFPAEAEIAAKARLIDVAITSSPARRLLEEDVMPPLARANDNFVVHRGEENKIGYVVTINELEFIEDKPLPQAQTITIGYDQVDVLTAVLLMPKNASVVLDVATAKGGIRYAFEVIVKKDEKIVGQKLLRDSVTAESHQCTNMRVVNVFGGISAASFWPNDNTKRFCESGSSPTSIDTLRRQIIDNLAREIVAIIPNHPVTAQR